jgi:pimeloyl-ACP methyl ester carboxylesterase
VTLVLVHGVPETAAIWDAVLAELDLDDVITLSPPGFGAPAPSGFGATVDDYQTWLVEQLERVGEPVDLFGHDWGGLHGQRLAATRPDLIRSWGSDVLGGFDPEYVWHELARTWQQPGAGEAAVAAMDGVPPEQLAAQFVGLGMNEPAARACVAAAGPEMARCILALYRSAEQPYLRQWGDRLAAAEPRPCLVVNATEDPYLGGSDVTHRAAQRFGAEEVVLKDSGHWWMMQDPVAAAAVLRRFLALGAGQGGR